MKKFPYLTFFSTWLLVFCGTLGAPLCVVTAYQLPYISSAWWRRPCSSAGS